MFVFARFAALCVATLALVPAVAGAQSFQDLQRPRPLQLPARPDAVTPGATAGPTIYINDANSVLWTVTLGTYAVKRIGAEGVELTDLGFDPKNGKLYGISFTNLYEVSTTTGKATYVGPLYRSDANALDFDASGIGYLAGVNHADLFTVNVTTGIATQLGSTYPYKSAGDLAFYNGELVLCGYTGGSPSDPNSLVEIDRYTGKPIAASLLAIGDVYGLVSTGKNLLYGFAQTSLYQLLPGASTPSKRAVLLKNLASKGVAQIYGAAYDGYFQY